jgi:5'-3' exonuclease
MFFRAYIVDPSLSTNGQPIGGLKGFLKILQKQIRETKPDEVIIAWDGHGGSRRRKSVNKNYKEGRKPIRLNRSIRNMTENEEMENKIWQQTRLFDYLNEMPIAQIVLPEVEADDVIAAVTNLDYYKGWQKVIVSSDKDFLQLCDHETVLYRPIQKVVMNRKKVIEEYGIHPTNMALARAIVGDKSDNLDGIAGIGLKTVAKRFPFMAESKNCTIDDLIDLCENHEDSKLKVYASIVEGREIIEQNYGLMQLYVPSLSPQGKQKIKYSVEKSEKHFNQTEINVMMLEDGMGVWDWSTIFTTMKRIVADSKE